MIVYLVVHSDYDVYDILGAYDNKTVALAHINDPEFMKVNNNIYHSIMIDELIVDSLKNISPHWRCNTIFQRKSHD